MNLKNAVTLADSKTDEKAYFVNTSINFFDF